MNDPQLESAMRNLASRVRAVEPPAGLENAVMAEFDRAHRRRPVRTWAMCGALAASLLAGVLLMRPSPKTAAPADTTESQAFYPIPYTPPLEPYERVMVVQKSVPVTELIALQAHAPRIRVA